MSEYFKNHFYTYEESIKSRNRYYKKVSTDLKEYLNYFMPESNILEIGCGVGNFAYFCQKIGVKNYTGIDIDDYFFEYHKKDFPNYKFKKEKFQNYLKDKEKTYDIIFTSHVFEHLDEIERIEMINGIYTSLKKGGIWINYMPNADCVLGLGFGRYGDITHKTVYTNISFEQLLNESGINYEIKHLNIYIYVGRGFFWRAVHKFFILMTKIYYMGMGRYFPKYYTWEFINIITKK